MILDDIIVRKRKDLEEMKRRFPPHRLKEAALKGRRTPVRSFKRSVSNLHKINLVCEIKKASPSEGILREDFQPLRLAGIYEAGGAAAISVLTEYHYFKGRPSYLRTIREVVDLPLLRKDFIFESYQLYESVLLEADAFLLISSLLTGEELSNLVALGRELGMEALVEVHNGEDLNKALAADAQVIGINNRNLRTLNVDTKSAKQLIPHIPKGKTVIVESGIKTYEDIMEYKSLGVTSFLVGTALMKSKDVLGTLKDLLGENLKWKK